MKNIIAGLFVLSFLFPACRNGAGYFDAKEELREDLSGDTTWKREAIRKFSMKFNGYRRENNIPLYSLFKRYYSYVDSSGVRKRIDRNAYDSTISKWRLSGF
ncbi:MAG TPA: hypothetical protein VGO58_06515 [Chitinophagaceae bacterium]|nr:hypothetical protein [Chitinophagaceae bacterium]